MQKYLIIIGIALLIAGCILFLTRTMKAPIAQLHCAVPLISHFTWGRITVCYGSQELIYKDAKLWPTGSKEWDWKQTGTEHVPGIQIADIEELMPHADIIILTRGVDLVLQVPQDTVEYITKQGNEAIVLQTEEAVKRYNELVAAGKRVAGVFHSTC